MLVGLFDGFLRLWAAAAIMAAIAHWLRPQWLSRQTAWQHSEAWQREIAYFDLLLAVALIWVADQPLIELKIKASMAIGVLSFLLGLHHLSGWRVRATPIHVVFTLGNALAVLAALGLVIRAGGGPF